MTKRTPEQRAESLRLFHEAENQYLDRPIMDTRLWFQELHRSMGSTWTGPNPEEHSPFTYDQEIQGLKDVLFGVRPPRTTIETRYLDFMDGVQKQGEKKWITCKMCSTEFSSHGFPAGHGSHLYPTICNSCADRRDARPVPKPTKRSTYSD